MLGLCSNRVGIVQLVPQTRVRGLSSLVFNPSPRFCQPIRDLTLSEACLIGEQLFLSPVRKRMLFVGAHPIF